MGNSTINSILDKTNKVLSVAEEVVSAAGSEGGIGSVLSDSSYRSSSAGEFQSTMESLRTLAIGDVVTFNILMDGYRRNLMSLNLKEKNITLDMLGDDAFVDGDPDNYTHTAQNPSYASSRNYLVFARQVKSNEKDGITSTQVIDSSSNSPYEEVVNLYPDENDTGTFSEKWNLNDSDAQNKNSILYKTKKLFSEKKINTIISGYYSNAEAGKSNTNGTTSRYGYSHGRNLLLKDVEKNGASGYNVNGYENPFCRVWTHHAAMSKYSDLIRPFSEGTGSDVTALGMTALHDWTNFQQKNDWEDVASDKAWKNKNDGWELSVLDKETGILNIAPKYINGGVSNIHTKQCMFSIENLAWKGYDPYNFEKNLSWEQRGPNGGRIMWFPPYGLQFSESTRANWTPNTFIGRGESVYTYANTERSGSLTFMLVVDHPSVVDYSSWYDESQPGSSGDGNGMLKETDYLRFFAGCDTATLIGATAPGGADANNDDPNNPGVNSVSGAVRPTPLTDEMMQKPVEEEEEEETPVVDTENQEGETEQFQFNVFYPNNYSGVYDSPTSVMGKMGTIHAIAYLLFGNGAQQVVDNKKMTTSQLAPLMFNLTDETGPYDGFDSDSNATGYEMGDTGITHDNNNYMSIAKNTTKPEDSNYMFSVHQPKHRWKYRIDGLYSKDSDVIGTDINQRNTLCQALKIDENYTDIKSFQMNLNTSYKDEASQFYTPDGDLYSLAEVAYAVAELKNYDSTKAALELRNVNTANAKKIYDILNEREIDSIYAVGRSNSHGVNSSQPTNDERNYDLAKQRAETVTKWLKDELGSKLSSNACKPSSYDDKHQISATSVNAFEAKFYRSALITVKYKKAVTTDGEQGDSVSEHEESTVTAAASTSTETVTKMVQSVDSYNRQLKSSDGQLLFHVVDKPNEHWTWDDVNQQYVKYTGQIATSGKLAQYTNRNSESVIGNNYYRYDQEYHFFKKLAITDPHTFTNIMDKIRYFNPAYHSMTPEGFNARLTFLNQCLRQGDTQTTSDKKEGGQAITANNLAFGRPPFCVLRIGDFYNQLIVIEDMSIDYDYGGAVSVDMNPEGVGVQPMLAKVTLQFKFIGGGDLRGPVRRLQNAMTFNYYANTSLYDNRADRPSYHADAFAEGSIGHDALDIDNSYAYNASYYKDEN